MTGRNKNGSARERNERGGESQWDQLPSYTVRREICGVADNTFTGKNQVLKR